MTGDVKKISDRKTFNVGKEWVSRFEEVQKQIGKENNALFKEWVLEMEEKIITGELSKFTSDLASAFNEDIKRLQDSLLVINNLFVNQMKGLANKLEAERIKLQTKHDREIAAVENENVKVKEENELIKEKLAEIKLENERLTNENEKLLPANEQLQKSLEDKESIIDSLKADVLRLNNELTQLQGYAEVNDELIQQVQELQTKLYSKDTYSKELESKLVHQENMFTVEKERIAIEVERNVSEELRKIHQKQLAEEQKQRENLNDRLNEYITQNRELYAKLDEKREEIVQLKEKHTRELEELRDRHKQEMEKLLAEISELKNSKNQ